MALPQAHGHSLLPGSANRISWFLIQLSAGLLAFLAHVSRESTSVPPTADNSTGALSPCPDAQAQATAIYGLPLALTLLSLLLFSRLHLTSLLVDCCVASLKLCLSHLKTLNFGLPRTQDCTCIRGLGPHPLISPSLPWEELSSWKSSAAQTILKRYRHKIYSVRILHLSLNTYINSLVMVEICMEVIWHPFPHLS